MVTDSKTQQPASQAAKTPHQSNQLSDGRNADQTGSNEFDEATNHGRLEFEHFVRKVGELRKRTPLLHDGHKSTGAIIVSVCDNFWLDDDNNNNNNPRGSRMAGFTAIVSALGSFFYANMDSSDQFRRAAYDRELKATEQNIQRLEDKYERQKERLEDKYERQKERLEDKYERNKKDETREYERKMERLEDKMEVQLMLQRLESSYTTMERPEYKSGLQAMLERLESSYATKMSELKEDYDNLIEKSRNEHEKSMLSLEAKQREDQSELTSNHRKALEDLETSRCEIWKLNKKRTLLTNALYGTNNGMRELPSLV